MDNTKYCKICFDNMDIGSIIDLPCGHFYCIYCLNRHIESVIDDLCEEICCPARLCDECIPQVTIENIISDEYLDKLNDIKTKARQNFLKYSQCPGCQRICGSNSNFMQCDNCDCKFCRICKCNHYDDSDQDDGGEDECPYKEEIEEEIREISDALDENLKQCPVCNILIEKDSNSCNSIKCKYCKTKFCWNCLLTANQVSELDSHGCDGYWEFHSTESDDEYNDGPEV